MPTSKNTPPTPIIDKVYSQGDFTIISSDSKPVKFQLPSYYLLAASDVIRGMQTGAPPRPFHIDMTDKEFEHAEALRLWLDFVTNRGMTIDSTFIGKARNVLHLARKYDCSAIARSVIALAHTALEKTPTLAQQIIVLAAQCDEPDLVAKGIRAYKPGDEPNYHGSRHSPRHIAGSTGAQLIPSLEHVRVEPSTWPLSDWQGTPLTYIWTINRALTLASSRAEQGDAFLKLIEAAKDLERKAASDSKKRKLTSVPGLGLFSGE